MIGRRWNKPSRALIAILARQRRWRISTVSCDRSDTMLTVATPYPRTEATSNRREHKRQFTWTLTSRLGTLVFPPQW